MVKPFRGDYILTQKFGENPDSYTQFGILAHNGLDYGLPTATPVLAPHAGKIIEATLDAVGYGLYLKIENDKEGSVLAHLKEFRVGVGDIVLEGQLVGYSDNSGNSTGPHLHWGYYLFPRDRQNGYAGFINQESLIVNGVTVVVEASVFENLVRKSTLMDKVAQMLNKEVSEAIIVPDIERLLKLEDAISQKDKQLTDANTKITLLEKDNQEKAVKLQELETLAKNLTDEVAIAVAENKADKDTIAKLKQDCQPSQTFQGWKAFIINFISKL